MFRLRHSLPKKKNKHLFDEISIEQMFAHVNGKMKEVRWNGEIYYSTLVGAF